MKVVASGWRELELAGHHGFGASAFEVVRQLELWAGSGGEEDGRMGVGRGDGVVDDVAFVVEEERGQGVAFGVDGELVVVQAVEVFGAFAGGRGAGALEDVAREVAREGVGAGDGGVGCACAGSGSPGAEEEVEGREAVGRRSGLGVGGGSEGESEEGEEAAHVGSVRLGGWYVSDFQRPDFRRPGCLRGLYGAASQVE